MRNEWSKVILTQLEGTSLFLCWLFLWINDLVNDYNNGNYWCIELDLIFAQTVTDGIDIGEHWLLFHKPQTAPNVTAVYRVHTAEYPQSSLNLNHSWQKTDKKNLNAGLNLLHSAP